MAVEECEQERGNVVAVAISIGQEDDLAIAEAGRVVLIVHPAAQGADDIGQFLVVEDLGLARLLGVEHLTLEGKDRLDIAVAALLGRAAGRVPFDDEQFRLPGVGAVAVVQLAGEVEPIADRRLSAHLRGRRATGLAAPWPTGSPGRRSHRQRSGS